MVKPKIDRDAPAKPLPHWPNGSDETLNLDLNYGLHNLPTVMLVCFFT